MSKTKELGKRRLQQLREFNSSVPSRATAFHERAEEVLRELEKELDKLFILRDTNLNELVEGASKLISVAPDLKAQMESVIGIEDRCDRLSQASNWDSTVSGKVSSTAAEWRELLRPLARVDSPISFEAERKEKNTHALDRVSRVLAELTLYEQFIDKLTRLRTDVTQLKIRQDMQRLETFIASTIAHFSAHGPDPTLIESIEFQHNIAQLILNAPKPKAPEPPPGMREIQSEYNKIIEWADALKLDFDFGPLSDRVKGMSQAGSGQHAKLEELRNDVREQLNKLRAIGHERREQKRKLLSESLHFYSMAVRDGNPQLEERLRALEQDSCEEAHDFEHCIDDLKEIQRDFESATATKLTELGNLLRQRVTDLRTRVDEQSKETDLTTEVRADIQRLKDRLDQRIGADNRDKILDALRATSGDEEELTRIQKGAANDRELFQDILRQREEIAQAAAHMSISIDLPSPSGLERHRVDQLRTAIKVKAAEFIAQAFAQLEKEQDLQAELNAAIKFCTDGYPSTPPARAAVAPGSPKQAALEWSGLMQSRNRIEAEANSHIERLCANLTETRCRLDAVSGLGGEDRQSAAELMERMDSREWELGDRPAKILVSIVRIALDCQRFFERLNETQRETESLLRQLQQRAKTLREEKLRAYFPFYEQRLVWLLQGIGSNVQDWKMAREQLSTAEELLTKMEIHGPQLAAQDLDRLCEAAEEFKRRGSVSDRERIERALAAVREHDRAGRLAPPELRQALQDALYRRTHA